jgi:hypothetical protein
MSDTNQAIVTKSKRDSFSSWKGNKYPQVKLRGFYSDVVSIQNSEKTGVRINFNCCLLFIFC